MLNGNKINGPSQQTVISKALQMKGVSHHDMSYMECHEIGSSLGDPIEVGASVLCLERAALPRRSSC